ncbi:hypothetical protein AMJ71_07275 [candidate division TA06 bacterium SM1_40]|uniref:Uncharacterized protein n=1 Tax=candidate division TA06 bacterium SM1_40 TaxID=1703773 RepID=A0A0S8JHC8_UNCT6|nr:MAG: hypothetical protein AMJ71_07275 [candidate division TA06 bacterium SM1_40]
MLSPVCVNPTMLFRPGYPPCFTLSITSWASLVATWRFRVTFVVRSPEVKKTTVPMIRNARITSATITSIKVNPADLSCRRPTGLHSPYCAAMSNSCRANLQRPASRAS